MQVKFMRMLIVEAFYQQYKTLFMHFITISNLICNDYKMEHDLKGLGHD